MNLLERNIVALFDEAFTHECIRISKVLHHYVPSSIVLNNDNMIPHMTLYTTNFPVENELKVKEKLRELTASLSSFEVVFTTPVIDMLGVWFNAEKTTPLQQVHERIVDELNPYRDGLYDEKELVAIGDNKARQESLVKYGMWAAKELYIPHVTLSRPVDATRLEEALHSLPVTVNYPVRITEIAYVERGPYGTAKRVIEKFALK